MSGGIASALLPDGAYTEVRTASDRRFVRWSIAFEMADRQVLKSIPGMQGVTSSVLQEYLHRLESRKSQVSLQQSFSLLIFYASLWAQLSQGGAPLTVVILGAGACRLPRKLEQDSAGKSRYMHGRACPREIISTQCMVQGTENAPCLRGQCVTAMVLQKV